MHQNKILPYSWQADQDGNKTHAWVFSALDTECTQMDLDKNLESGKISQAYHDALQLNKYGGDTPPQNEYWLQLT